MTPAVNPLFSTHPIPSTRPRLPPILKPHTLADQPLVKGRGYSVEAVEKQIGLLGIFKRVDPTALNIKADGVVIPLEAPVAGPI
jgi:hypothetical protein